MVDAVGYPLAQVAGMILWITSFGADNALMGLNYVGTVRDELGLTELLYTDDLPPICHFSIAVDDVLSLTTVPTLQSLLNARIQQKSLTDGLSVVHLDPNDPPLFPFGSGMNHWLAESWNASTLTDAETTAEAVFNFVTATLQKLEAGRGTERERNGFLVSTEARGAAEGLSPGVSRR